LKDTERATKKQKLCAAQSLKAVSALQEHVQTVLIQLDTAPAGGSEQAGALAQLRDLVAAHRKVHNPEVSTKELHSAVSKLGKSIERAFVADICRAPVSRGEMDQAALDRIIAAHLFQQGRFEIAESFAAEAALDCDEDLRKPFANMHSILKQIELRNLQPALEWVDSRRDDLAAAQQGYEAFEFQLHRLQFLRLLAEQGPRVALKYRRLHNTRFHEHQALEATRLMGSLCYASRLEASPYRDLVAQAQWDAASREFVRQCCGLMGLALESPLLVAVAAGSVALPTLLKLADILQRQGKEMVVRDDCLPVEVELGNEFVFHSIFACPVSKDQSTRENPPMLLPCGHVLCKVSISKIARSASRMFKCPYCPNEATISSCRPINFPDIRT